VDPRARLAGLLAAVAGRRSAVVQTHDNPDPDCIGSAVALRYLLQRYLGIPVIIAHGGTVGRSENRAMLRVLRVKAVPASRVDYARHDLVCVVDSQPAAGYVSLPEGVTVDVIFDHHPVRVPPVGARFVEIDEKAGSTCTLMGEMILANGIPVGQEVATALVYGMKAETLDLGRESGPRDEAVYTGLYALANKRLLSRILSERVPRSYFATFARALREARVHGSAVLSDLGEIPVPDMVPEMADFLLRLREARWSCVAGSVGERLFVSVRAGDATLSADRLLRRALHGMGSCGGHGSMAGGQVPLHGMTREERDLVRKELFAAFLRSLRIRDRTGSPLLDGTDGAAPGR
jgi:nanoRNase/pAp phosphatase (c-di-AMP/oligoRNAs hydrolase)